MRIIRAFQIRDKNKLDKTAPKMTKEAAERWRQSYRKSDSRYYIERERRSNGGVVRYRHEKARKKAEAETGAESDVDDGIMREKRKTFRQIKVSISRSACYHQLTDCVCSMSLAVAATIVRRSVVIVRRAPISMLPMRERQTMRIRQTFTLPLFFQSQFHLVHSFH